MSSPIGESLYLDRDQCEFFETAYMNDGVKFVCSAEAWLKSKAQGYDEFHINILKPLGPATIVAVGTGYGWFEIKKIFPAAV